MRNLLLAIQLCFISFCFGQNKLEFKITSINRIENKFKTNYTYEINYSVKNISSEDVSFFLNKNKITSNATGSMSNSVIYRFYQDDNLINAPIFNRSTEINPIEKEKREAEMQIQVDAMMKEAMSYKNTTEYTLQYRKKELISQVMTLKPGDVLSMSYDLSWNKLRNISYMDTEYYLDENSKYYLDFSIYLLKKPFDKYLSEEEKKNIIHNPNFIEGNYTSEKFEIFLN
ncbi:MAG: hypothetical protein V4670_10580 [Bacteroidota bacterium]